MGRPEATLDGEGEGRLRASHGDNYDLAALKAKYDPGNFFRMYHKIAPTATRSPDDRLPPIAAEAHAADHLFSPFRCGKPSVDSRS